MKTLSRNVMKDRMEFGLPEPVIEEQSEEDEIVPERSYRALVAQI